MDKHNCFGCIYHDSYETPAQKQLIDDFGRPFFESDGFVTVNNCFFEPKALLLEESRPKCHHYKEI